MDKVFFGANVVDEPVEAQTHNIGQRSQADVIQAMLTYVDEQIVQQLEPALMIYRTRHGGTLI